MVRKPIASGNFYPGTKAILEEELGKYIEFSAIKKKVVDKILRLDPEGLMNTVAMERISMCGAAPTAIMLSAALELGVKKAEVIDYTNSGRVMGDYNRVVAYLSMIVY